MICMSSFCLRGAFWAAAVGIFSARTRLLTSVLFRSSGDKLVVIVSLYHTIGVVRMIFFTPSPLARTVQQSGGRRRADRSAPPRSRARLRPSARGAADYLGASPAHRPGRVRRVG